MFNKLTILVISIVFPFLLIEEPKVTLRQHFHPLTHKQLDPKISTNLLDDTGALTDDGYSLTHIPKLNLEQMSPQLFIKKLNFLRIKKWDFFSITAQNHIITIAYADLGYASAFMIHTYDYKNNKLYTFHKEIFTKGIQLDNNSFDIQQNWDLKGSNFHFVAKREQDQLQIKIDTEQQKLDVQFTIPAKLNQIVEVLPLSEDRKQFFLCSKSLLLKVEGSLTLNDQKIKLEKSMGGYDIGRGVFPYKTHWVWATAQGYLDEVPIGLNLVTVSPSNPSFTMDFFYYNDQLIKLNTVEIFQDISQQKMFHFQSQTFEKKGDIRVNYIIHEIETTDVNQLLFRSKFSRHWGVFSGEVYIDDKTIVKFNNIKGFIELNRSRW